MWLILKSAMTVVVMKARHVARRAVMRMVEKLAVVLLVDVAIA